MHRIGSGMQFTLEYTLRDETGAVREQRLGADAVVCTPADGLLPAGLTRALAGQGSGYEATIALPPEAAFGPRMDNLVFEAPQENLPAEMTLEPGSRVRAPTRNGNFSLRVIEITSRGAVLDGNHPLAGHTLYYSVRVTDVQPCTPNAPQRDKHQP